MLGMICAVIGIEGAYHTMLIGCKGTINIRI